MANEATLRELHTVLAEWIMNALRNGVDVIQKDGSVRTVTAPASYGGVAVTFLHHNKITAVPENDKLRELAQTLTKKGPITEEEFEKTNALASEYTSNPFLQ